MNPDWVDAHHIPYTARFAFFAGAVLALATLVYSVHRVPELPLGETQRAAIAARPRGFVAALREIADAIRTMPVAMRKLALMSLFQWYAMQGYWSYVIYAIARSVYGTSDPNSSGFHAAVLANGNMAAFYNGVAFAAAFVMMPVARRIGPSALHAICLVAAGLGMIALARVTSPALLFVPALGVGLGWASIMGNPYAILAEAIPAERTGVYMGIFNMMIVIPMILIAWTLPLYYDSWLGGQPGNVLTLCGALMMAAAAAVLWTRPTSRLSTKPALG
jgi:maltose/moltooligosaccharide transporter